MLYYWKRQWGNKKDGGGGEKRTDINREFVASLSTRNGTKDERTRWRFVWISIFSFTWLECNSAGFDKIALPYLSFSLSLSSCSKGKLSLPTVPLFRNGESRSFGNELSRGNSRKRGEGEEGEEVDCKEQLSSNSSSFRFSCAFFSHLTTLPFVARRGKKTHSCWQTAICDIS